jgi:cytochrome c oxidase cbb3-type subunit 3
MLLIGILLLSGFSASIALAQDSEGDPERGGALYVENCAMCHGIEGQGRIGASLDSFPGIQVNSTLEQTISEGISGSVMPSWSSENGGPLSSEDVRDIVSYIIEAFEGTAAIAPAPTIQAPNIAPLPDISGDPSLGAVVYQVNCIACHGDRGQGRFGRPLAKDWPGNQPDVFIRQVVSEGISGTVMPAWGTELGGPLSADDLDNVTSYVLSLPPVSASPTAIPGTEGPLGRSVSLIILGVLAAVVVAVLVIYYRRA